MKWKYFSAVFIGAASYGILSTIVVIAYGSGFQLGELVGTQLLTGCLLAWGLAAITWWMHKQQKNRNKQNLAPAKSATSPIAPTGKQIIWLMLAGMPTAITGLLYYQSLRYIPASLAIVLLFQFTWISVLIQAVGQRKRPTTLMLLTLVVLLGGTVLAAGMLEQNSSSYELLGIAFGLLAAVSYSLFILFSGKAVPQAHPVYRSAWMISGGLLLTFALFPPAYLFNGLIWGQLLLFGLLLGLFGAFIPPLLFAVGVPHIGGDMAGILGAIELPVAVMLSSLVLHEHVSPLQWVGVVLILAGVILPELIKHRQYSSRTINSGS